MNKSFWSRVGVISFLSFYFVIAQKVNWEKIESLSVGNVTSIAVNSNDVIFVEADDSLYRSNDGGNEWIKLNKPEDAHFYEIFISSDDYIYYYGIDGIYLSEDNGESWRKIYTGFSIYGIIKDYAGRLFAANCFDGVICSSDNGENWIQVLDSADVHGIVILPSEKIIAACYTMGIPSLPGAYKSDDNGVSWQTYLQGFTSLDYNSTGILFAVAGRFSLYNLNGNYFIYRSTDDGESWDSVYQCNELYQFYGIVIDKDDQIFSAGSEYGIMTSSDNGNSWYSFNAGLQSNEVYCVSKNSDGEIFVGTPEGIYKCINKTITAIYNEKQIIPQEFVLKQNFPNPFNPSTKINYSIPKTANIVIRVYDILGNEIETLANDVKQKGSYELTWNAENLPSGVYFYQLRAGSFIQTKKMILLK